MEAELDEQRPPETLCSSEAWVSFAARLAVSDDSVSNGRGRVVLSGYYRAFIYQVLSQGPQL